MGGLRLHRPTQRSCSSASSPLAVPPPLPPILPLPQFISRKFRCFRPPSPPFPREKRKGGGSPIFQLVASEGERIESATSLSLLPPSAIPTKYEEAPPLTHYHYTAERVRVPLGDLSLWVAFYVPTRRRPFFSPLSQPKVGGAFGWENGGREGRGGESWLRVSCRHSPPHLHYYVLTLLSGE